MNKSVCTYFRIFTKVSKFKTVFQCLKSILVRISDTYCIGCRVPTLSLLRYSKRPKFERSDFGHLPNRSVCQTKCLKSESNWFHNWFGTGSKPVWNQFCLDFRQLGLTELSQTEQKLVRFAKPNVQFSDVHCIAENLIVTFFCRILQLKVTSDGSWARENIKKQVRTLVALQAGDKADFLPSILRTVNVWIRN